MGRSRGGPTTKIHALVDANGLPIRLKLTEGQAHDGRSAADMVDGIGAGQILLADRAYDSDGLRQSLKERGAWANVKPMPTLAAPIAPKVLVITMFAPETAPWRDGRKFETRVAVPGLSKEFPDVACDAAGLCVMTTSMGYANAATSVAAVIFSGKFELSKTYLLVAGMACRSI